MSSGQRLMAHRALKAHTFPEAYGVNLVTKRPRPRQSNSSYNHQLLRDVPLRDRSGVDRSIGDKNGNRDWI
jgi:hypothetical protein